MEIILLRHGKPTLDLKGYIKSAEFKNLTTVYAQSGIKDQPAKELIECFNSHYIVCSDLERSIQSAKKLELDKIHLVDQLFKETDIPYFELNYFKLPVIVWLIVFRIMWLFGFNKNGESFKSAKIRAKQAAIKLITLAEENQKVLLVGHGLLNRLIAKQLRINNWTGPVSPGKKHWEFGRYNYL